MELDRRGCVVWLYLQVNQKWEEPREKSKAVLLRLDNRSWMTGDCHVQFWESARVRLLRATQLSGETSLLDSINYQFNSIQLLNRIENLIS